MTYYQKGDVFLVAGKSLLSGLIRFFTRSPGEPPTKITHVGMVVQDGSDTTAIVMEAMPKGVLRRLFSEGPGKQVHFVYRPPYTHAQIQEVVARALEDEKLPYDWAKNVSVALDWFLGGAYIFRRLTDTANAANCSFAVWDWYQGAERRPFNCNRNCSPDTIADYVEKNWKKV